MRIAVVGPCRPREFAARLGYDPGNLPYGLGGTPVNSLVRSLLDLGHSVHLISASPDIAAVERFDGDRLSLSVVPYRQRARERALDLFLHERQMMAKELARIHADVVHSHWAYEFGWVGVTSGLPNVLTVHDAPLTILRRMPDGYRMLRSLLAFKVSRRATFITAVSPNLAAKWTHQMRQRGDIRVIPNISPEFDRTEGSTAPDPDRTIVLDIADGGPLKNVRTLLRAFNGFRKVVQPSELRLIGPGLGAGDELAAWARNAGLADGVRFLGLQTRPEVSRHLMESSMLCHASLEESQGMCFLEAMSHSVPVIGGRESGGVAWTLDEGRAGVLVDVTDSDEILNGMLELRNDPVLRAACIAGGDRLIAQRYSGLAVASAYIMAYEEAILASRVKTMPLR